MKIKHRIWRRWRHLFLRFAIFIDCNKHHCLTLSSRFQIIVIFPFFPKIVQCFKCQICAVEVEKVERTSGSFLYWWFFVRAINRVRSSISYNWTYRLVVNSHDHVFCIIHRLFNAHFNASVNAFTSRDFPRLRILLGRSSSLSFSSLWQNLSETSKVPNCLWRWRFNRFTFANGKKEAW